MTPSRSSRSTGAILSLVVVTLALYPGRSLRGQEQERPAPLRVERITVAPASPGVDTLCRLTAAIRNEGEVAASQLAFTVRLNGEPLAVYESQLYYQALPPGETSEVRLYNFWTTETGRGRPADGKLVVEVVLEQARWMKIERDGDTETWTPVGEVSGLPSRAEIALQLP
ncbi:MAG TPA: CARDB domain-containing protein [Thermoanaerobaculia bacterium]|nr:CARDB domain-containing protein [Thermoanaerobaculia bacterium]